MKAPAFQYAKPASLPEVFALMAQYGDEARLLAGGQTLLATLNMRLSEPALLIDLQGIEALRGIRIEGDMLRIGAMVTHSEIEASALVARHVPLLRQVAPHIAHRAIRNRGTLGGSIAYADPAAEWPACLLALEGVVLVQGPRGQRRIAAKDFFVDLYTTSLASDELLIACEWPLARPGDAFAFDELARRHGDYASVGLAVSARLTEGVVHRVRLAFLGVANTPLRATRAEAVLEGQAPTPVLIERAVHALREELQPLPDLTHTSATKRHLAGVLAQRLLQQALFADANADANANATARA